MVAPSRLRRALPAAVLALLATTLPVGGQNTARVQVEENVRAQPNGDVIARMSPGATLAVTGRQDRWIEVSLEGWVWSRSLQTRQESAFDLVVSEAQGENLRDAPSGTILGRLGRGTFLEEVERRPGWIRVRRTGWIWSESVAETSGGPGPAAASSARPSPPSGEAQAPAARRPGGVVRTGAGTPVLSSPGGDTLARTVAGADLEVVAREGNWARVRLEGWSWLPVQAEEAPGARSEVAPLTPAQVTADPSAHRGRVVSWELQFISLERAEKVRTDFFEGEPFLLTRFGASDGPFVYVAVPADRVQEMQGLVPLERLRVTGRVRVGASSLTGTPIIDLVALERVRGP